MPALRITLFLGLTLALVNAPSRAGAQDNPYAADEAELKDAGLKTDGPALVEFFRQRTPSEGKRQWLAATVRQLGHTSFSVREQASAALVAAGPLAVSFLKPALQDADLEIARRAGQCLELIESGPGMVLPRSAARLLAARRPDGATEAILDYLPFVDDDQLEDDLLATLGSVAWHDGRVRPVLARALQDALPARRAAAALILGQNGRAAYRAEVLPLLADPDPRVRLRAAQGLVRGKEKIAVPTLVALLTEAPPALASQAEETLYHIAGDDPPQLSASGAGARDRAKYREAWAAWWREHEASVDLAELEQEQRPLGLTLVVVYDGYGGHGRVCEMHKDGKPRWVISDVRGCLDGQMVSANRVLLAEYDALRVTERNLQGKVLWKFELSERPVACQRLPNGNTLVATNKQILEVSPAGKAISSQQSSHGLIFAAQKLRNGRLVYATHDGLLVELSAKGEELTAFRFQRPTQGLVSIEVLPGGRFLIPITAAGKVVEFNAAGKSLWECPVSNPTAATRLANGNTLICSNHDKRVVEVDRAGKVIWEQHLQGRPFRVHRR